MWFPKLFALFFFLILAGCASSKHHDAWDFESFNKGETVSFNNQVASLPEGSSQYFATSPFGPSTINVEGTYTSALGHECRSVRALNKNTTHKFVLCRKEKSQWHIVPLVFKSIAQ